MAKNRAVSQCSDGYINPYTNYGADGKLIHLDYENNVIERTEYDHPYSYSARCTWAILGPRRKKIDKMTTRDGVYSDRMKEQDSLKFEMACRSVWGNQSQRFESRFPKDIEKMLQIFYANPKLKLYRVLKECNLADGYPVWHFSFYTE